MTARMSTLPGAPLFPAKDADTIEAQDARWNAWKVKGAAADRMTHRRMRMVMTGLLIALVLITMVLAR